MMLIFSFNGLAFGGWVWPLIYNTAKAATCRLTSISVGCSLWLGLWHHQLAGYVYR